MRRRAVQDVGVRWRVDVGQEVTTAYVEIDLDGRTTSLTVAAAQALQAKLPEVLNTVGRFAAEEAARAAIACPPGPAEHPAAVAGGEGAARIGADVLFPGNRLARVGTEAPPTWRTTNPCRY
jgi:hypothetical protein